MNARALIEKIRGDIAITGKVRDAATRWGDLQDAYYETPCHSDERRLIGGQIAGCVELIADGIDASKLASWVGFIGSSEALRRDAEGWRNGDDMSGVDDCPHVCR